MSSHPSEFEAAVRGGDLEKFRRTMIRLKAEGTDIHVDEPFNDGVLPLSTASRDGFEGIVRELVEVWDANVNQVDQQTKSALDYAAIMNRLSIAEYLCEQGAHVDPPSLAEVSRGSLSWASFHNHAEMASMLIERGADVNGGTITPLHIVAQRQNSLDCLKLLVENGADANQTTKGECPLHRALSLGSMDTVLYLLTQQRSPISPQNLEECTQFASSLGLTNVVSETLRIRNGSQFTSKVDELSHDVIEKRAIARKMMSHFERNESFYRQMKNMILDNLKKHDPFSDDILLAVVLFAQEKQDGQESSSLWSLIMEIVSDCLTIRPRDSPQFVWFEQFLVNSAIWFEESTSPDRARFSDLLDLIREADVAYPVITAEEQAKVSDASILCGDLVVDLNDEKATDDDTPELILRQDSMVNGLQATHGEFIEAIIDKMDLDQPPPDVGGLSWSTILTNKNLSNEDILMLNEYDKKVYLNSLKLLCDAMLPSFYEEMHRIHDYIGFGELKVAPVKRMSRAIEKIGTDYYDETNFPKSARIVDLLRCSFTFDDVQQLVTAVIGFESFVNENAESRDGCTQIVRVKNGLLESHDGYKDVKLNIVFESRKFGKAVIAEVQCLLKHFLKVKKEQHRTYSIVRKEDVFHLVRRNAIADFKHRLVYNGARFDNLKWLCRGIVLGGDVNRKFRLTPLVIAVHGNNVAAMKVLLENGAEVNQTAKKATALWAACNFGFIEAVEVLLDHGADANIDRKGELPKMTAQRLAHTNVVQAFESRGL